MHQSSIWHCKFMVHVPCCPPLGHAEKKKAQSHALHFWGNRTLASAWTSWQSLVAWRRESESVAREHAHRLLAYLTVVRGGRTFSECGID